MPDETVKAEIPVTTRILVVDDSKTMMDEMTKILATFNFTDIKTASNGTEGWNLILEGSNSARPIEIVLCDWNMPGQISGIQLLEKVRVSPAIKNTVFILVTTENTFEKVKKAMDRGVSNYIIKPYEKTDVIQKLNLTWKKRKPNPIPK